MKVQDLFEGTWVIKNKDGKEKRFKDDTSPEAKAWASSSSPVKTKVAAYSQKYWDRKKDESESYSDVFPSTKIDPQSKDIEGMPGFSHNVDDLHVQKRSTAEFNGVMCATADIRVVMAFDKDDDMGLDEPTSDAVYIRVRRDEKKPKTLVFVKYL